MRDKLICYMSCVTDREFADLVWKSVLTFDFESIIMINKQYTTGKDGW